MRLFLSLSVALVLAACQMTAPWKGAGAPAAKPAIVTGGPIAVTPLAPAEQTGGGAPAPQPAPEAPKPEPQQPEPEPQQPEPEPQQPEPEPAPPPAPKSEAQLTCEKQGGTWSSTGMAGMKSCIKRTRDAGKQCRRESDCEGVCLARSRTCAPVKPLFGCNPILQDDGREVVLCLD